MIDTLADIREYQNKGLDLSKWQGLVNMLAELFEAASGDIIQYRGDHFTLVSTSENEGNFLSCDDTWIWESKTFCRYIVEHKLPIYINDAPNDEYWADAPFVADGTVCSYYGEPIYWPNGEIFGSFCVIDNKPTKYCEKLQPLLTQLKLLVESELQQVVNLARLKTALKAMEKSKVQAELEYKMRLQTEVELAANESIVSTTLETLVDAVIRIDPKGTIQAVNSATLDMFQYAKSELIGRNIKLLMPKQYASQHNKFLQRFLNDGTKKVIGSGRVINAKRQDGSLFPVRISVSQLNINEQKQFIGLVEDISEKVEYENKLKTQALHDTLTGCANRLLLEQSFIYQIDNAVRNNTEFSVAYVDLDGFKPVNDGYGHKAGDQVLVQVCKRLKQSVRATDLLARVGGDEFVIVFNERVDETAMTALLLKAITEPIDYLNTDIKVNASLGYAVFPQDGNSMDTLMEQADKRMYQHKQTKH